MQLHRELEVGYCRSVTISTDNITETNEYRTGVGAHSPFCPTCHARCRRIWTFAGIQRCRAKADDSPHVIVLEPVLVIYKIYNRSWCLGRPTLEELR